MPCYASALWSVKTAVAQLTRRFLVEQTLQADSCDFEFFDILVRSQMLNVGVIQSTTLRVYWPKENVTALYENNKLTKIHDN